MEIRFDDELTCRFALEVEWSTATHVSVVSQRGSECQTLLQNGQFISELRKGTKPVIRLWQEKVFICYFRSFQNFSMKSNCLTLGQKSPKSLIATAAILVVRTARGAGATSLPAGRKSKQMCGKIQNVARRFCMRLHASNFHIRFLSRNIKVFNS